MRRLLGITMQGGIEQNPGWRVHSIDAMKNSVLFSVGQSSEPATAWALDQLRTAYQDQAGRWFLLFEAHR